MSGIQNTKITLIAAARPNFMKIAPIIRAMEKAKSDGFQLEYRLVHTGQHYDKNMSSSFFEELNIPEPHVNLEAGGGTQAEQTAQIMVRFEKELMENPADAVLVVGDVTSTMACAITAQKLMTPVIHVEAGIRSGDWTMPEEINRLVTDSITNVFFTTTHSASEQLLKNGIPDDRIYFVGNTMIDTLLQNMHRFTPPPFYSELGLSEKKYIVMTLHRPSNVDSPENLMEILEVVQKHSGEWPVIFPVHPRTRKNLDLSWIEKSHIHLAEPLSYLQFNFLVKNAIAVITDSGGITEETTVMGIPCMTLRNSTERPETCTIGTNELLGTNPAALIPALETLRLGKWKKGAVPELWDGRTSERIVENLIQYFGVFKR